MENFVTAGKMMVDFAWRYAEPNDVESFWKIARSIDATIIKMRKNKEVTVTEYMELMNYSSEMRDEYAEILL